MKTPQRVEIDRFLSSGNYDNHFEIWPGDTFDDRTKSGSDSLRTALISEVLKRAGRTAVLACQEYSNQDIAARAKFAPMVRGLFPQREQSIILDMLERSVVFLTPETINSALKKTQWLKTAWDMANLYLASVAAKPLNDDVPGIVGLSAGMTCYVSIEYFRNKNQFEDYVIHEAAHIFHNCKRETLGLPVTRHREWLLDIDFAKRETFAYACEAYSRILKLGKTRVARSQLLAKLAEGFMPPDERVQGNEYVDILKEAVAARNGWKYILNRCSPTKLIQRT